MLKGMGSLLSLMKNAGQIRGRMGEMQEELAKIRVEGSAGAGMVVAEANGQQKLLAVRIDPEFFAGGDREMLEDLVTAAVNQAFEKARQAAADEMAKVADVPGLGDLIAKMTGEGGAAE